MKYSRYTILLFFDLGVHFSFSDRRTNADDAEWELSKRFYRAALY